MGLFEQFPYQNFHELNLDWLINEIKKLGDSAVLSVNGQTGDVILYQSENIVFPEVESNQWRMVRTADGHTAGVMFQNGLMYVMFDSAAERVYTVEHPPTYPVTSVNGQTGAVELYQSAGVRLPDVTDDYTNVRRQIQTNGQDNIVGIEVKADKAYRMKDSARYDIYDSANQPPYPVSSVNGQTGAVMLAIPFASVSADDVMFTQAASGHEWGIGRETLDGTSTIQIRTDASHAEAWVDFFNEDTQVTFSRKLLTTDDIPSGSGVISVNGLAGVVVITGTNIKRNANSQDSIEDALDALDAEVLSQGGDITDLQDDVQDLQSAVAGLSGADGLAYIVTGDTANAAVPAGAYAYIKNNTHSLADGYYQNTSASAFPVSGGTADSTVFTAVPAEGVLNSLNNKFVRLLAPTAYSNNNDAQLSESIENYDELYIELYITTSNGFRIASSLIPVSVIKNNGYGTSNQYIINAVGTANVTSDKIAYVIFAQIAFKNAQTINMASSGYNGWSGTLYVSIYAK